jgi:hypothetical protein
MTARNIVPDRKNLTARILCTIYAERQESEIRVTLSEPDNSFILAPGLVKLTREKSFTDQVAGLAGSWGYQQEVIGDIGMAIIASPAQIIDFTEEPMEHRVRCRPTSGQSLRYWIIGDWRRGRQHPIAPTIDNWRKETQALASQLNSELKVRIGTLEKLP